MKKSLLVLLALLTIIASVLIISCTNKQTTSAIKWEEKQQKEELTDAIFWNEAKYHIGETLTVYGPVVSTYYYKDGKNKPTFLNIGNPNPDLNRFTVIIWEDDRENFSDAPEVYYKDKTIYVYGKIKEYEGVPEIIISSPSQIINN